MISIEALRVLWHPKGVAGGYYEDAAAFDLQGRRFAIADGVSSAIFSDVWAIVLVDSAVKGNVPLDDTEAMVGWLAPLRNEWKQTLPTTMNDFQLQRLQETRGGHSTLLGVNVIDNDGEICFESYSIGDCCMFVFRNGKLHTSFPGEDAAFFGINPTSLPSSRIPRERHEAERYGGTLEVGDNVVLASDAIACWMFKKLEAGEVIDLNFFEEIESLEWSEWVRDSRNEKQMRVDDVTLMMFRIGESGRDSDPIEIPAIALQESEVDQAIATTDAEITEESDGEQTIATAESETTEERDIEQTAATADPHRTEENEIDLSSVGAELVGDVVEVTADVEPATLVERGDADNQLLETDSVGQPASQRRAKLFRYCIIAVVIVTILATIVVKLLEK